MAAKPDEDDEVAESGFDWRQGWETMARVSLAATVGAIVGLAKDQKQHLLEQQQVEALNRQIKGEQEAVKMDKRYPRKPPQLAPRTFAIRRQFRFLGMWSLSCGLFATILESFRRSSPTSLVLDYFSANKTGDENETNLHDRDTPEITQPFLAKGSTVADKNSTFLLLRDTELAKRSALTAIGDYGLGGFAAGFAGAVAQRKRSRAPGLTYFGLATGLGLGLLAGTLQAAVNLGHLYIEQLTIEQEESTEPETESAIDEGGEES